LPEDFFFHGRGIQFSPAVTKILERPLEQLEAGFLGELITI